MAELGTQSEVARVLWRSLPFYVREKEYLKLYGFANSQIEEVQVGRLQRRVARLFEAPPFPLTLPKAACWSPDGIALAMVSPARFNHSLFMRHMWSAF